MAVEGVHTIEARFPNATTSIGGGCVVGASRERGRLLPRMQGSGA